MRILSMTATFGKLSHETLTLRPGLNIIEAPNEWGKSTWCAFLIAMLYGIDTSARTTKTSLAPKTRYEPWSGAPMSGRMDIAWNGKSITIERQSKGRVPFGVFRAYETESGLDVPELTADNCGQTLLGVERSVFTRAGFLKLTDLPVEQDEALRRRLNALVTTGDESGTADTLEKTLKELKNHCRVNKKGLLPQAEAQKEDIQEKLRETERLQAQTQQILHRQQELNLSLKELENHQQALAFAANQKYSQKLAEAQLARNTAATVLSAAKESCSRLPSPEALDAALQKAGLLRDVREQLHTKVQLLPPLPAPPESPEPFRGMTPEQAVADAKLDTKVLQQLNTDLRKPLYLIPALVLLAAAVAVAFLGSTPALIGTGVFAVLGIILLISGANRSRRLRRQILDLQAKYRNISPENWVISAQTFADARNDYTQQLAAREEELKALNRQMEENNLAITQLTGNHPVSQFEQDCKNAQEQHRQAEDAARRLSQAEDLLQALTASHKEVAPPRFSDKLTLSEQETAAHMAQIQSEQQRLHQLLGNCQGQMESLGEAPLLHRELTLVEERIAKLEETYAALELAQATLTAATEALQRRFAPRISQRAQELLGRLTGGRYDRLTLASDFTVHTGAAEEDTLHTALWRSDGTADQLYLALRLAVAEELTPDAPLVLDDALVRFDDTRLAAALKILEEEAQHKQVLLFTCHNRESALMD